MLAVGFGVKMVAAGALGLALGRASRPAYQPETISFQHYRTWPMRGNFDARHFPKAVLVSENFAEDWHSEGSYYSNGNSKAIEEGWHGESFVVLQTVSMSDTMPPYGTDDYIRVRCVNEHHAAHVLAAFLKAVDQPGKEILIE